jgi:hypothetical protein
VGRPSPPSAGSDETHRQVSGRAWSPGPTSIPPPPAPPRAVVVGMMNVRLPLAAVAQLCSSSCCEARPRHYGLIDQHIGTMDTL